MARALFFLAMIVAASAASVPRKLLQAPVSVDVAAPLTAVRVQVQEALKAAPVQLPTLKLDQLPANVVPLTIPTVKLAPATPVKALELPKLELPVKVDVKAAAPLTKIDLPKIDLPKLELPKLAPATPVKALELPKLEFPVKVDVKAAPLPKIDLPKLEAPVKLSSVSVNSAVKNVAGLVGAKVNA